MRDSLGQAMVCDDSTAACAQAVHKTSLKRRRAAGRLKQSVGSRAALGGVILPQTKSHAEISRRDSGLSFLAHLAHGALSKPAEIGRPQQIASRSRTRSSRDRCKLPPRDRGHLRSRPIYGLALSHSVGGTIRHSSNSYIPIVLAGRHITPIGFGSGTSLSSATRAKDLLVLVLLVMITGPRVHPSIAIGIEKP